MMHKLFLFFEGNSTGYVIGSFSPSFITQWILMILSIDCIAYASGGGGGKIDTSLKCVSYPSLANLIFNYIKVAKTS